jgi:transcriptional regulator with XRE-family HTH domain
LGPADAILSFNESSPIVVLLKPFTVWYRILNYKTNGVEAEAQMHIAQKFEGLLEMYRRPDGRRWSGQEIDEATGGIVTRSYVTNLRKGRIENPGFEKLKAIAKVMDFPPELWFEESPVLRDGLPIYSVPGHLSVTEKTNRLFDLIKNETTRRPYTNAEVARLSLGDLTEEHVEQIRAGKLTDPSMKQVVTLAEVFGVHPAYFLDSTRKLPLLDQEAMSIFRDETVSAIAHKSLHLPGREKQMILGIIRQFEDAHEADDER